MSFRYHKSFCLVVFAGILVLLGLESSILSQAQPKESIKALLKERLAILSKMQAIAEKSRNIPPGTFDFVQLRRMLLDTQLELADSKEERLKAYRDMISQMEKPLRNQEEFLKEELKKPLDQVSGQTFILLGTKAFVLELRIAVEREKLK